MEGSKINVVSQSPVENPFPTWIHISVGSRIAKVQLYYVLLIQKLSQVLLLTRLNSTFRSATHNSGYVIDHITRKRPPIRLASIEIQTITTLLPHLESY